MPNHLTHSTSPYLQQHASNPVAWQEWGTEALQQSRDTGKPILLSIGYSACHWCHVMAHESFEDEGIAALMNRLFINIKVDREERPDIDQIYQTAHHMLTHRSGGWPLTMFLTPQMVPYFGGTYFPKSARYGLPGFGDLLVKVEQYFREETVSVNAHNAKLLAALNREMPEEAHQSRLSAECINYATQQFTQTFDNEWGGFGQAPKFPHPESIEHCLRFYSSNSDEQARHMACFTLERMCKGGIYDQLGGGFSRYSVDSEWAIPHFEKMLYDNGPLLRLVSDAWLVAENVRQKNLFARVAAETAAWVMREMQSIETSGYFSSIDADSEGHEGKFYVWTTDTVKALLSEAEFAVLALHYGLDVPPNFENEAWHFVINQSLKEVADSLGKRAEDCEVLLKSAREKLFRAREKRIHPGRDEKILASWNALMIQGLAHTGRIFNRADWVASARAALEFIRSNMWTGTRLLAVSKDGKTHLNAYLDDYAFLLNAIIEMLQADFCTKDLQWANEIANVLLLQFEDQQHGGFFFTSHDHETLIQRPKPAHDNATPSGNGMAAIALQRLYHLTGEIAYEQATARTLAAFSSQIAQYPSGSCTLLIALEESLSPPRFIILRGDVAAMRTWQTALAKQYLPNTILLAIANDIDNQALPATLQRPTSEQVVAYVCQGVACLPAINNFAALQDVLKDSI